MNSTAALFSLSGCQCFDTSFVLFGFYCVLIGYLTFRSTFLPRTVGVLMVLAGIGWLTFIYPPAARHLSPAILVPGIIGEGSLTLWLLAGGRRFGNTELSAGS